MNQKIFSMRTSRTEYYRRRLTTEELDEISQMTGTPWRMAIVHFLLENGNEETPADRLIAIAKRNGYRGETDVSYFFHRVSIGLYSRSRRSSYRITYDHSSDQKLSQKTLFRFYRKVEKS